jgi:hypothetical protein
MVGAHAIEDVHRGVGLSLDADAVPEMVFDGCGILRRGRAA